LEERLENKDSDDENEDDFLGEREEAQRRE
jgi:hypothetical protein